jgi:phosphoribosyl 1,2-cyclic phosphodiesterase
MGLSFILLGSGSSGNATLVSDGDTHILVDVGLSGRETAKRLRECGLEPEQISAIVVSHEHGDHCRGVGPFAKSLDIPVFMTDGTHSSSGMILDSRKHQRISAGECFDVYGFLFTCFSVPHDSADPLGFVIEKDGTKIGIALDLGYLSNLVLERLKGCDGIILESNHDVQMLKVGPYPWALKQRVMSRRGHLSNDSVAQFLGNDYDGQAAHIVLAHLSKKNNLPEIALLSAQRALEERSSLLIRQTKLELAQADKISKAYRF